MDTPIQDLITATLAELGLPAPANFIQTMLMKDGFFAGWKYRYDGGHAVLSAGSDSIEFYNEDGTLLTTVVAEADKGAAA